MSKILTGAVAAAALIIVGGAAASSAMATDTPHTPPPPPAWVNADGTTDVSKVPDKLPVMGSDGNPLKDKDGKQVYVPSGVQPPAPGLGRRAADDPNAKRWTETDSEGHTIEHVDVAPTAPAAG
ncbi:hypothetical protein WJM95_29215 [Streptomyces sp. f51]|uniref:hypothetical protein n=1 Tax=Streptomyces sp. f51 TaxID=1827742 RepID=UPI0030CFDB62